MPANIEIKAEARDWSAQLALARRLFGVPELIRQEDAFFRAVSGRLKLRMSGKAGAQLIHYLRADSRGPKRSSYRIHAVADPAGLKDVLTRALGAGPVVRKTRRLFLSGRARVHFDEVEGLGRFIELEVVLKPGESSARGRAEARRLMARLGIGAGEFVDGAYADLHGRFAKLAAG